MKSDWTPGLVECNVTGGLHSWEEGSESDHGRGRYRCSACFVYLRPLDVVEDMMRYRENMIEWKAKYDAVVRQEFVIRLYIKDDEVVADYRHIAAENAPGREDEAIANVKGACLHCLGDMKYIHDTIRFEIVRKP